MLFHVTITHPQEGCPGRRTAETVQLIGPADRLKELGDELSVTSHSVLWGASCLLWAEPEHVAYALLEASGLEAVERYLDALTPAGWSTRVLPVFALPSQLAAIRQFLAAPASPFAHPPPPSAEPADDADSADTLEGPAPESTEAPTEPETEFVATLPDADAQLITPLAEEPPDKRVTRIVPQPVADGPQAASRPEEPLERRVTRPIPPPIVGSSSDRQPVDTPPPADAPPKRAASPDPAAITRFIKRPASLEARVSSPPAAAPPDARPEPPAPGELSPSESSTVILEASAQRVAGLRLVASSGPAQGTHFEVGEAGATIGRLPENSICLTDGRLSRFHARIEFRDGGYWLSDVGSQNGTLVNDRPVTDPHRLQAGDSLQLGTSRLTVMLDPDD